MTEKLAKFIAFLHSDKSNFKYWLNNSYGAYFVSRHYAWYPRIVASRLIWLREYWKTGYFDDVLRWHKSVSYLEDPTQMQKGEPVAAREI